MVRVKTKIKHLMKYFPLVKMLDIHGGQFCFVL